MVEGLVGVLILAFLTLIIGIILKSMWVVIPQILLICIVVYLLVRVRVKISKAEKEKLREKIDELEKKISTIGKKEETP
ncbi:MAG TPA: hypothetical protein ENI34_03295 [candidate division WOR-3 bacterium]|uniref:Uncharacterized protein n=1 Tax=candidate division WOR-3 bacterium TaxID=2052148 RepID=A0A9C9EM17_UNCW3|nr:hypothetical protein [candidate division WOR-3 bacterium]